jgi:hypothetical protein
MPRKKALLQRIDNLEIAKEYLDRNIEDLRKELVEEVTMRLPLLATVHERTHTPTARLRRLYIEANGNVGVVEEEGSSAEPSADPKAKP